MGEQKGTLNAIKKLARCRVNDAVRLAFLSEGQLEELKKLDLSAVTEFKRSSNGTIELKFVDRLAALQWLMDREGEDPKAARIYQALEKAAQEGGEVRS